jgi:OOP family OmpA-OmpF porin
MKATRTLACLAVSGLLAQPILASEIYSDAGVSISAGGGVYKPDSERELHSDYLYNLGLGYRFNENWELEVNYMASEHDIDDRYVDETADLSNYRLDGLYYFSNGALQPYVSLGVGEHEYKYQDGSKVTDTEINAGLGVKWFLTPGLFVRADARLFDARGGVLDSAGILSVGYLFGQSAKQAPVVAADDDNDGVENAMDQCADTPEGTPVDEQGCGIITKPISTSMEIDYAFNSVEIDSVYDAQVAELVELMRAYPNSNIMIEGHTDNSGSDEVNLDVSQRRADELKRVLVEDHGIDGSRITTVGKGAADPAVANDSAENRKKNRRVIITLDE